MKTEITIIDCMQAALVLAFIPFTLIFGTLGCANVVRPELIAKVTLAVAVPMLGVNMIATYLSCEEYDDLMVQLNEKNEHSSSKEYGDLKDRAHIAWHGGRFAASLIFVSLTMNLLSIFALNKQLNSWEFGIGIYSGVMTCLGLNIAFSG